MMTEIKYFLTADYGFGAICIFILCIGFLVFIWKFIQVTKIDPLPFDKIMKSIESSKPKQRRDKRVLAYKSEESSRSKYTRVSRYPSGKVSFRKVTSIETFDGEIAQEVD